MQSHNKWIPIEQCYPPNNAEVEALFDGKVCNAIFHDAEDYRSWTVKKDEYDGTLLPTAWRFPSDTISIVLKVDIENMTSEEVGI